MYLKYCHELFANNSNQTLAVFPSAVLKHWTTLLLEQCWCIKRQIAGEPPFGVHEGILLTEYWGGQCGGNGTSH